VPLLRYCREPWHAGDAGKETYRHWHTADRDRLISDVANARFQAAQMVAQLQTVTAERDRAGQRADALQIQLDDTSSRLQRSEAQFQAAMNGRVMRLMTGMQRVWRRWKGGRS
jgi:hypothetical protein